MTDVRKEPQAQANPPEAEKISGAPQLDQPVRVEDMPPHDYVRPRGGEQPVVDALPVADRQTGIFLNLFNTRAKRIRWGIGSAATGAAALVVGLMLPKGDNGSTPVVPDFPEHTNSASPNPSESAPPVDAIRPGYHYAETPVIELAPLPANLEKYESMPLDEYIQLPAQERVSTYGAYLVQNIYTYAARFQEDSGEEHDILNKITPNSGAFDSVQFLNYVARLGLSFQSEEDPTKVDVDKALKLYASFLYTSPSYDNNAFNDLKAYLEANPNFVDVDYAYTSQQFAGQGALNILDEGTRTSAPDFDGSVMPQVQNYHYSYANQPEDIFSTSVLYSVTDPVTGQPVTYPVYAGRNAEL